jgi:hypothetical protein
MLLTLEIQGLAALKERLSSERLTNNISKSIVPAAMLIHEAVDSTITNKYSLNRSLTSVLQKSTLGRVDREGSFISTCLVYEYAPIDLSKFPYTYEHIPITNSGAVHTTTVIRKSSKKVIGKSGNGGFVPRNRKYNTNVWLGYKGGAQMFERIGKNRNHLRLLLGPSLSQMAKKVFVDGDPLITQAFDKATQLIIGTLAL